jgi:hypothetical protein
MDPPCTHLNLPSKAPNIYIKKKLKWSKGFMQLDKMLALSYNHCKYPIVSQKIFLVGVEKPFQLSFQLVTRQLFSMGHEGDKLYISS